MTAPPIALDDRVSAALQAGAYVVHNLSGGKDSGASALAVTDYLDSIGHPRERRLAIHADLGRAEWRETPVTVERQAQHIGAPLTVVRRKAGDMVARWEQRFERGLARYVDLRTYNLIGPWSSPSLRFCTSELKAQVIGPHLSRILRGETIVQVIGIRRQESANRRKAPVSKADHRYAKPGNKAGTEMLLWHPLVDWTVEDVFAFHAQRKLTLHPAYGAGCSRVSCAYCIMQSEDDAKAASNVAGNFDLYRHLVGIENRSTFSFWADRWLSSIAPSLLTPGEIARAELARTRAEERRRIEAAMPAGLRYVKGWPVRVPTFEEAVEIGKARAAILDHHRQPHRYTRPQAIIDRFAELMGEQKLRAVA